MMLADLPRLRKELHQKVSNDILPDLWKISKDKAKKLDHSLKDLNEKQLLDVLIEELIEKKCVQPSFIMNHPLIMSPLAKSHAHGRYSRGKGNEVAIPESIVPPEAAPFLSERFELFINQMEVINSYSE